MNNQEIQNELPPNYEELKKSVNRMSDWRERIQAVDELGQWKHHQTIDVLMRVMSNDPVYKVQEAAFRKLQKFGVDAGLPPKKKGEVIKGTSKILVRIKKSLPKGHTFEEFKEKLQKMRSDVYDTYEGEKGAEFDQWLEEMWAPSTTE
ncbi:MAG: HEAT repeat domain-containing protein [Gorillibacterium sp.]|nr:HEAT repeat domain-containing protein [Gorillibacterium sp.]